MSSSGCKVSCRPAVEWRRGRDMETTGKEMVEGCTARMSRWCRGRLGAGREPVSSFPVSDISSLWHITPHHTILTTLSDHRYKLYIRKAHHSYDHYIKFVFSWYTAMFIYLQLYKQDYVHENIFPCVSWSSMRIWLLLHHNTGKTMFGFKTRKKINNTIEYLDLFLGTAGTTINQQTLKNISWHKK